MTCYISIEVTEVFYLGTVGDFGFCGQPSSMPDEAESSPNLLVQQRHKSPARTVFIQRGRVHLAPAQGVDESCPGVHRWRHLFGAMVGFAI